MSAIKPSFPKLLRPALDQLSLFDNALIRGIVATTASGGPYGGDPGVHYGATAVGIPVYAPSEDVLIVQKAQAAGISGLPPFQPYNTIGVLTPSSLTMLASALAIPAAQLVDALIAARVLSADDREPLLLDTNRSASAA